MFFCASACLALGCDHCDPDPPADIQVTADSAVREQTSKLHLIVRVPDTDPPTSLASDWIQVAPPEEHGGEQWSYDLQELTDHDGLVEVVVQALDEDGNLIVEQRAVSRLGGAKGKRAKVVLALVESCIDMAECHDPECAGPECDTCRAGDCERVGEE